nr:MAG TPA: hypothetical protein [Caudoviricetes sp.]
MVRFFLLSKIENQKISLCVIYFVNNIALRYLLRK